MSDNNNRSNQFQVYLSKTVLPAGSFSVAPASSNSTLNRPSASVQYNHAAPVVVPKVTLVAPGRSFGGVNDFANKPIPIIAYNSASGCNPIDCFQRVFSAQVESQAQLNWEADGSYRRRQNGPSQRQMAPAEFVLQCAKSAKKIHGVPMPESSEPLRESSHLDSEEPTSSNHIEDYDGCASPSSKVLKILQDLPASSRSAAVDYSKFRSPPASPTRPHDDDDDPFGSPLRLHLSPDPDMPPSPIESAPEPEQQALPEPKKQTVKKKRLNFDKIGSTPEKAKKKERPKKKKEKPPMDSAKASHIDDLIQCVRASVCNGDSQQDSFAANTAASHEPRLLSAASKESDLSAISETTESATAFRAGNDGLNDTLAPGALEAPILTSPPVDTSSTIIVDVQPDGTASWEVVCDDIARSVLPSTSSSTPAPTHNGFASSSDRSNSNGSFGAICDLTRQDSNKDNLLDNSSIISSSQPAVLLAEETPSVGKKTPSPQRASPKKNASAGAKIERIACALAGSSLSSGGAKSPTKDPPTTSSITPRSPGLTASSRRTGAIKKPLASPDPLRSIVYASPSEAEQVRVKRKYTKRVGKAESSPKKPPKPRGGPPKSKKASSAESLEIDRVNAQKLAQIFSLVMEDGTVMPVVLEKAASNADEKREAACSSQDDPKKRLGEPAEPRSSDLAVPSNESPAVVAIAELGEKAAPDSPKKGRGRPRKHPIKVKPGVPTSSPLHEHEASSAPSLKPEQALPLAVCDGSTKPAVLESVDSTVAKVSSPLPANEAKLGASPRKEPDVDVAEEDAAVVGDEVWLLFAPDADEPVTLTTPAKTQRGRPPNSAKPRGRPRKRPLDESKIEACERSRKRPRVEPSLEELSGSPLLDEASSGFNLENGFGYVNQSGPILDVVTKLSETVCPSSPGLSPSIDSGIACSSASSEGIGNKASLELTSNGFFEQMMTAINTHKRFQECMASLKRNVEMQRQLRDLANSLTTPTAKSVKNATPRKSSPVKQRGGEFGIEDEGDEEEEEVESPSRQALAGQFRERMRPISSPEPDPEWTPDGERHAANKSFVRRELPKRAAKQPGSKLHTAMLSLIAVSAPAPSSDFDDQLLEAGVELTERDHQKGSEERNLEPEKQSVSEPVRPELEKTGPEHQEEETSVPQATEESFADGGQTVEEATASGNPVGESEPEALETPEDCAPGTSTGGCGRSVSNQIVERRVESSQEVSADTIARSSVIVSTFASSSARTALPLVLPLNLPSVSGSYNSNGADDFNQHMWFAPSKKVVASVSAPPAIHQRYERKPFKFAAAPSIARSPPTKLLRPSGTGLFWTGVTSQHWSPVRKKASPRRPKPERPDKIDFDAINRAALVATTKNTNNFRSINDSRTLASSELNPVLDSMKQALNQRLQFADAALSGGFGNDSRTQHLPENILANQMFAVNQMMRLERMNRPDKDLNRNVARLLPDALQKEVKQLRALSKPKRLPKTKDNEVVLKLLEKAKREQNCARCRPFDPRTDRKSDRQWFYHLSHPARNYDKRLKRSRGFSTRPRPSTFLNQQHFNPRWTRDGRYRMRQNDMVTISIGAYEKYQTCIRKHWPGMQEPRRSRITKTVRVPFGSLPLCEQYPFMKEAPAKVKLAKSSIHGIGLFADETIDFADFIIEYVGEMIRVPLADVRERRYRAKGLSCLYMFLSKRHVIDATRMGGPARFVNHSCTPNCIARIITYRGSTHILLIANKVIKKGEEICYNYLLPEEPNDRLPCNCGAPNCKKFLN